MNRGFTLVEILVVMGIIAAIFAFGILIDSSSLVRQSISSEQSTLVSVLQKARSRAMNNIDAMEHGVHIEDDSYVLFRKFHDDEYEEDALTNEKISRNESIAIEGTADIEDSDDEVEVVFTQLSGSVIGEISEGIITLSQNEKTREITLLGNGLIDW